MVNILASSRSGSTSLTHFLSELLGLKSVISPKLNSIGDVTDLKKDVIHKIMIHSRPNLSDSIFEIGSEVIKISDKVILLDRENKLEQAESLAFKKKKYKKASSGMYHTKEYYDDIDEDLVDLFMKRAIRQGEVLLKLSSHYKIPLFTYETIYYGNGLDDLSDYLNVKIDENLKKKFLSESNKQRIFNLKII